MLRDAESQSQELNEHIARDIPSIRRDADFRQKRQSMGEIGGQPQATGLLRVPQSGETLRSIATRPERPGAI